MIKLLPILVILFSTLCANPSHADPIHVFNDEGGLAGVNGLTVNSGTWNMAMHGGSFDDLIATSQESPVYDANFAFDAMVALRSYFLTPGVLVPIPIEDWTGCNDVFDVLFGCVLGTAISANGFTVSVTGFEIDPFTLTVYEVSPFVGDQQIILYDGAFLTWECTDNCTTVPEPPVVALFLAGLIGMSLVRRRKPPMN